MKSKKISFFCLSSLAVLIASNLLAWDGYDYNESEFIEIEKGNLVRQGKDIDVYHYNDGSYHQEEVQGIYHDELETYDYETGEFHYYDMD